MTLAIRTIRTIRTTHVTPASHAARNTRFICPPESPPP